MVSAGIPLVRKDKIYTYKDYLKWSDDERWELINGTAYSMTPSPSRTHQKISRELFSRFYDYLKDKNCEVYYSPFDVRLPVGEEKDEDIKNVVQPDLAVICDQTKLDERGCKGAPDLIVEIVSPSTAKRDLKDKFYLYERAGVREYWIVQSINNTVMVFKLKENKEYGKPDMYTEEDKIKVGIFDELVIDLKEVFK